MFNARGEFIIRAEVARAHREAVRLVQQCREEALACPVCREEYERSKVSRTMQAVPSDGQILT